MGGEKLEKSLGMKDIHQLGFVKLLDVMGDDEEVENSARISYGEGTRKVNQTRNLIRYLMRHKHTSPFEMCEVKFHLKLPIFIMRQLVRHRTANLNEYSGRYSVMSNEFYLPEGDYLAKQSTTNNQGRGEPLESQGLLQFEFNRIYDGARALLPVANYTECIWKIDLHNFFHFVKLRADAHAQREIRDYADAMYELVKPNFPLCCEAFEDYRQDAVTFSKQEMEIIKDNMNGSWVMSKYNLSERESTEFLEKIKKGDTE